MNAKTYSSVWDAVADSPGEARNLELRGELMDVLEAYIAREGVTQRVAAERLGVPRSRISELVNGRISKFTIDKLVNMAARVGLQASVTIRQIPTTDARRTTSGLRVLGVDFTSRPTRRKPITVADCDLCDDELTVRTIIRLSSFEEFEGLLARDGPWVAAIDMPFAQPRVLVDALGWPSAWRDCVAHVARLGKSAFEQALDDYRIGRDPGQKEHLRETDRLAKSRSPMKLHYQPVGKMFFQGAPRLLRSAANIVPCGRNDSDRTILEAYPALVAESLGRTRSYKNERKPTPAHKQARRKIAHALRTEACRQRYGVRVAAGDAMLTELVEDSTADLLDAVLCAVQGAWASRQPDFGIPPDCENEGWIVDPALLPR